MHSSRNHTACLSRRMSASGGVSAREWGVCLGGVHTPVNRMTDTDGCKNITFPQLRLGALKLSQIISESIGVPCFGPQMTCLFSKPGRMFHCRLSSLTECTVRRHKYIKKTSNLVGNRTIINQVQTCLWD